MLYENISYPNHLPFKIFFSNIVEENYHYHKELEMSFILRGTTHYKIHHLDYSLSEGQIIIVDSSDLHRIFGSSDDILMLTIQVDLAYFSDIYPAIDSSIFVCEIPDGKDPQEYQELQNKNKILKRILTKIMVAYQQKASEDILLSYVGNLVSTLVEQFQDFVFSGTLFKPDKRQLKEVDMQRYLKISDYMYTNYQDPISLETISEYLHLSPYYVSHLVKNVSGLNFKNYLNYVRVEYSEKMLAEQVLTLTEICETCGFSSLAYFSKCFSFWHGKTPAQYRKDLPDCTRKFGRDFSEAEGEELLLKLNDSYRITNHSSEHVFSAFTAVEVDFLQSKGAPFREKYGIRLLLSSLEDLLFLCFYKRELMELHPVQLLIRKDLLKTVPAPVKRTVSLLLDQIKIPVAEISACDYEQIPQYVVNVESSPSMLFPLTGGDGHLIYSNGLFTSVFHELRILANISGNLVAQQDGVLTVRENDTVYLLIYKTEPHHESCFHITFKNAASHVFVTENRFENNTNYWDVINKFAEMETVPAAILHEINSSFSNKKIYTLETRRENLSISLLKTGVILLKIVPCK